MMTAAMVLILLLLGPWLSIAILVILVVLATVIVVDQLYLAPPPVVGIKAIAGYPIVGNSLQVFHNPAQKFMKWQEDYKADVFQIRVGGRRMVVANSHEAVTDLWVGKAVANNSRPVGLLVFHAVVSTTQGPTLGLTPFGDSYRKKKKALGSSLQLASWNQYGRGIVDNQTMLVVRHIISSHPELQSLPLVCDNRYKRSVLSDVCLLEYFQHYALGCLVRLAYGFNLDGYGSDHQLARDIVEAENHIIRLRLPVAHLRDAYAFLLVLPLPAASFWREKRDDYMAQLMARLEAGIEAADPKCCQSIVGRLVTDPASRLLARDLSSLCVTLVSAGLDNTSLLLDHLMGQFSQPGGGKIQDAAFAALMAAADGDVVKAWRMAASGPLCPYVEAIVREGLRFFTVLPLALPRATTRTIRYKRAVIPAGTELVMNAYAANHDPKVFPRPNEFDPGRWLDCSGALVPLKHLGFGSGARRCLGSELASHELYVMVCRMVLVFRIRGPVDASKLMGLDPFEGNLYPRGTSFEPKKFCVRLEQRQHSGSNDLYRVIKGDKRW